MNSSRRDFLQKLLLFSTSLFVGLSSIPFIRSWLPSSQTKLLEKPIEVDISKMRIGDLMTVIWQGKPLWILRRTPAMLQSLQNTKQLLDPNSLHSNQPAGMKNEWRSLSEEFFVSWAKCTHLGCIPMRRANSFICPCHGSKFDMAGRVYRNVPAPRNLDIPDYYFKNDGKTLVIGSLQ